MNKKEQWCIIFTHPDWDDKELYCCERFATVTHEGDPSHFFHACTTSSGDMPNSVGQNKERTPTFSENEMGILRSSKNTHEDIDRVRGLGLDVDDDNEPAPENLPGNSNTTAKNDQTWGWSGFCLRKKNGFHDSNPFFKFHSPIANLSFSMVFLLLLPVGWLQNVLLKKTNENLEINMTYGELLRFLGLILKMSTTSGFNRRDFWTTRIGEDDCPYKFNEYMSRNRFENILKALTFTDIEPLSFVDNFWEVRQMISEWNINMKNIFIPSWISCLDESISI